jgi:DNA-binding MarR family transcriptional regulator
MHVRTYIYMVNLEEAIKSSNFKTFKQKASLNILYTAWWLKTVLSKALKEKGLTHEQYNVLRILKGKHPEEMCVKDIACRMIEKSSNVPRIADRLVVKNLVHRSVSAIDKRETVIRLTKKGIEFLEVATAEIDKVFEGLINLNEQKAQQLNMLLEEFREKE